MNKDKIFKYYIICFGIVASIILLVLLYEGISQWYVRWKFKSLKHQKTYYLYEIDKNEVWEAPFVKKEKDLNLLLIRGGEFLPYYEKFWILDTLDNKFVEFIGIREDCWGMVTGYTTIEEINSTLPDPKYLARRNKILEERKKYQQTESYILQHKTGCYGSIYGFFCSCDEYW